VGELWRRDGDTAEEREDDQQERVEEGGDEDRRREGGDELAKGDRVDLCADEEVSGIRHRRSEGGAWDRRTSDEDHEELVAGPAWREVEAHAARRRRKSAVIACARRRKGTRTGSKTPRRRRRHR
jgi:hypothetical protein